MISVPAAWFERPFDKVLKKVIRPPTARTRREEITIRLVFPRVLFEELMVPLTTADVDMIQRTSGDNPQLIATKKTAATEWFVCTSSARGPFRTSCSGSSCATQRLRAGVELAALVHG